jgi:hypothetical protein
MRRFFLTILTFAIVGPPVGLAVLTGLIMLRYGSLPHPEQFDVFLLAAYVFGSLPAFIAGALVASLEKPGFWPVARVGLIMGLVLALLFAITLLPRQLSLPRLSSADVIDFVILVAWIVSICVVPTVVCWLVVRAWSGRVAATDRSSEEH